MEAAIVKPKPRIRAGASDVRDKLNRFMLIDAMETADDKHEETTEFIRLALVSRAHLASVRRTVPGMIKFERTHQEWLLRLKVGLGAPKIAFPVDQTEMSAIIKLLGVPVHLKFGGYYGKWYTV
ncbi:hypothetical protein M3Y99_00226000 [Aphelenchoides fujianensis]|nr:hypothetical protein M3Y99_00226000 [Aphelenchoides fujianensis]